jgi:AraC-like DNA-binding protein
MVATLFKHPVASAFGPGREPGRHTLSSILERAGIGQYRNVPALPYCEAGRNRGEAAPASIHLRIGAVKSYIENHADEDLDLDRIAEAGQLSKFHLVRLFQAVEGITPWAYVQQVRLEKAKKLLEAGLPLAEVALLVGFYDQSHFTRAFRQAEGETPGHYRKRKIVQDRPAVRP